MRLALARTALVCVVLAGCVAKPPLPPPGARGGAVFHLWDTAGGEPVGILASAVLHRGGFDRSNSGRLELSDLTIRLPFGKGNDGGILLVRSPSAEIDLANRDAEQVTLRTPVQFCGIWMDSPMTGRADSAVIDRAARTLTLRGVELVHQGAVTITDRATITDLGQDAERRMTTGSIEKLSAPPAVAGALAALPTPLLVPPLRLQRPAR
jgi:hypothetical protein